MTCKHYWICGQPIDGYVESICRKCGKVKRFETLISMEYRKAKANLNVKDWSYDSEHLHESEIVDAH